MSEKKIWAYLVHLSTTMWSSGDPESIVNLDRDPKEIYKNCETHFFEEQCFWELMEYLPAQGVNTVLVDVGNAVQYERHPEISMKEAMTKDQLKGMCDRIRALGMDPVPKLNFSCGHNPWLKKYSRMVGTEEYYGVTRDCIDEVAEIFGYPAHFHLGLDEETKSMLVNYGFRNIRAQHIWWRDAYRLFDRCAHHNIRPWVWSDVYWEHPEEFKKNMPKEVLQSNWWYTPFCGKDEEGKHLSPYLRVYGEFEELGYDQVPTCSCWHNETNTDLTFQIAKEEISADRLKGVMTAPWFYCEGEQHWLMMQDALRFGLAKKKYFPGD